MPFGHKLNFLVANLGKLGRLVHRVVAFGSGDDSSDHKLVSVLESNGKAMQAELAADRELRKEQGINLVDV
ncbi:hypothetical protein R1flu_005495 [Riccia fluitans]|uniref:Uncharacterized protein n=1 Tax=Riccia fluitans TaxID=41844 RepID=A0ABD1YTC0_9MARC